MHGGGYRRRHRGADGRRANLTRAAALPMQCVRRLQAGRCGHACAAQALLTAEDGVLSSQEQLQLVPEEWFTKLE